MKEEYYISVFSLVVVFILILVGFADLESKRIDNKAQEQLTAANLKKASSEGWHRDDKCRLLPGWAKKGAQR